MFPVWEVSGFLQRVQRLVAEEAACWVYYYHLLWRNEDTGLEHGSGSPVNVDCFGCLSVGKLVVAKQGSLMRL